MKPAAGPKPSPPDHLRVQCARVLPRLQLIPEFKPWLQISLETTSLSGKNNVTVYNTLWYCFALGAPLCVLLDLLGTPSSSQVREEVNHDNMESLQQEKLLKSFVDRVHLLEVQGRLPYGEVFGVEDLFHGTHQGFAKVLKAVERVLGALQATYPGLYFLPVGSTIIRADLFEELIDSERAHVDLLATMAESAEVLLEAYKSEGMAMTCLAMYLDRLLQYHDHILLNLDKVHSSHLQEDWDKIFALDQDTLRATAFGAQRSYCVHYLAALDFLEDKLPQASPAATIHIQLLLEHLSEPLHRISDHRRLLQSILDLTIPTDCTSYDSICLSLHRTSEIADQIDEIGLQLRTMKSAGSLQSRVESWDKVGADPEQLGLLILDDLLLADATSGLQHSVFLYESMLLCCHDSVSDGSQVDGVLRSFSACYPIAKWEFGPAMSRNQYLDILFAVPTGNFNSVRRVSAGALEIDWIDQDVLHTHSFTALFAGQCDQWYLALQAFVPQAQNASFPRLHLLVSDDSHESMLSEDEELRGRRSAHPRPWSLVGRKGPRSESSSMILQEYYEHGLPQSPDVLPSLFYGLHNITLRSPSPSRLSVKTVFSQRQEEGKLSQLPPTPPPDSISSNSSNASGLLPDLTGKISREGKYPCAHGGFADVWKGIWRRDLSDRKVAIKVLRSHTDDPESEAKMHKRLRRELRVWQRLDHENILPLLGTVSDFGNYSAFVCPWLENGSVSRYLERCGCVLSMMDCLQLLCEVAAGLSYLHSNGVVHGDLTGSNILIDDEGKACLCDFGLSSIAAEFQGTSYLTSTIGGNVRWAAPELYRINEDDSIPTVTTQSDIYSFGSVVLEVLSGHVPYSYLLRDAQVIIEVHKGVKPRRPTTPMVTNQLWCFINTCWDEPNDRPNITEVSKSMQNFLRGHRRNTS